MNRSGRQMIAYFIISVGRMISVAVIQIPVGGAAAGVQIAKCEKMNNSKINMELFIPTMPAKLYKTGIISTTTIRLVATLVKMTPKNNAITMNTSGFIWVNGISRDISVWEMPVSAVFM